jgi:hypothetical protein
MRERFATLASRQFSATRMCGLLVLCDEFERLEAFTCHRWYGLLLTQRVNERTRERHGQTTAIVIAIVLTSCTGARCIVNDR